MLKKTYHQKLLWELKCTDILGTLGKIPHLQFEKLSLYQFNEAEMMESI